MAKRSYLVGDDGETRDTGFFYICSGYLVEDGKVLLVHHNRFDKWVPPGGYVEPGETFAQTAEREFLEETGIAVEAISIQPIIHPQDNNATPLPVPFYTDMEREGFRVPAIVQFFYVRRKPGASGRIVKAQEEELFGADWFGKDQLKDLPTFDQVRSLAKFALDNHPSVRRDS